ncbi:MAG: GNAT family N-acetyltransferase [Prevotellaceae bacterium]|jgi:hypothetical protein|nr:GNAT family N-acetyltransferase [Prevotellaceae bacterium]
MENIIDPIDKNLILSELNGKFLRKTKKACNEIYVLNAHNAPNTMQEIGRLREISFRNSGGGSGKSCDIDEFDFLRQPFEQLIVWNPDEQEIVGGYRFLHLKNAAFLPNGEPNVPMGHIFSISQSFIKSYLQNTIELGRAFIQPKYQSIKGGIKSLFSLDNLWDGLGAMVASLSDTQYLIGKVTIYPQMEPAARYAIIYYLAKFFPDAEKLFIPKKQEIIPVSLIKKFNRLFCENSPKSNFRILNSFVKKQGENIPPLIRAYIELSDSMRTFGTCIDDDFGHIRDTGLMITIDDIYEDKKKRYLENYYLLKNVILRRKL